METRTLFCAICLFLIGTGIAVGQVKFVSLNEADFEYAHTTKSESYMGKPEKELVQWLNLARVNGPLFAEKVLMVHRPDSSHPAVASLLKALKCQRSMEPLMPEYQLYKSATAHANDLGFNGSISSNSSNGQPYYDRIHQYMPGASRYAEVYTAGTNSALDLALSLLLDAKDDQYTTRKALLNPKLQWVGCSLRPHSSQCYITVLDLVALSSVKRPETPEVAMDLKAKQEHYGWNHCPKGSKVQVTKPKKRSSWFF